MTFFGWLQTMCCVYEISNKEQRKRCHYGDATKIMLGNNNKFHVGGIRPECIGEFGDKERNCRVSVMFWGCTCISYHGVGTLTPVDGNINTEKYISILDDHLWPVVAHHFANEPGSFRRTMHLVMCQQLHMNGNEIIPLVLNRGQSIVQTSELLNFLENCKNSRTTTCIWDWKHQWFEARCVRNLDCSASAVHTEPVCQYSQKN